MKQKYPLNPGERIVFKISRVRHGFWGAYTNTLTITNQGVILEKYGMLNNFKGIERFDYSAVNQAIQGEASNGERQLELYVNGEVENFALQSGDENEMKVLVMAINDQIGPDAENFDFDYYQSIVTDAKDTDRILELREKAGKEYSVSSGAGVEMAGTAAKNLLLSGDFSARGISKAVAKAAGKQKKSAFSGMMDGFLEDIGVRDIQDEFTEMGNEIREEFGLRPKMTYAERKELADLEEKRKKQEIQRQKTAVFQNRVAQQKAKMDSQKEKTIEKQSTANGKMSVKEQMELLQQMKSLLDAGVLTQEEFEKKKQEILNI